MTIRNKYLVYNESKFFVLFQCTCSYRIKQEREREKKMFCRDDGINR